jgi:hypothetical protein
MALSKFTLLLVDKAINGFESRYEPAAGYTLNKNNYFGRDCEQRKPIADNYEVSLAPAGVWAQAAGCARHCFVSDRWQLRLC